MRDDLDDMGLRKGMGDFEEDQPISAVSMDWYKEAQERENMKMQQRMDALLFKARNELPAPPIDYPKPPDTDIQKLIGELKVLRCSDSFIKIDRVIQMLEDVPQQN